MRPRKKRIQTRKTVTRKRVEDDMAKRIIAVVCLVLLMLSLLSCKDDQDSGGDATDMTNQATENKIEQSKEIAIARKGEKLGFVLSYNFDSDAQFRSDMAYLKEALEDFTGATVRTMASELAKNAGANEILIGDDKRDEVRAVRKKLKVGEFGIEAFADGEKYTVAIAYRGEKARMCAIQYLLNKCFDTEGQTISLWTEKIVVGEGSTDNLFAYMGVDVVEDKRVIDNFLIYEKGATMRDPNAAYYNGYYYLYGTGWLCYRATSLEGPWVKREIITHEDLASFGIDIAEKSNPWAPELHQYNGKFYLFTTYSCGAHD